MRKFFQQWGGAADIMLGRSGLTWDEAMAMPHEEGWHKDEEEDDDDEYEDDDYFDDWRDESLFDDDDDELEEDWAFESEDWSRIVKELFSREQLRSAAQCVMGALAFLVLYYPLLRGYCWLVLAIAYWCGTDGSVWPGPYTPYPEQF